MGMAPQHIEVGGNVGRASEVSEDERKGRTQPPCALGRRRRSAWKGRAANFRFTAFSEVRIHHGE
jgi:hypothetical protein